MCRITGLPYPKINRIGDDNYMKRGRDESTYNVRPKMRPASTPEAREDQLISLAVDLAEQQLRDGTASSQVITHYLKLGSTRERKEQELLDGQIKLNIAKAESLDSSKRVEELYANALKAFQSYGGHGGEPNEN